MASVKSTTWYVWKSSCFERQRLYNNAGESGEKLWEKMIDVEDRLEGQHMNNWCLWHSSVQFSSVAQSCPTLCDPMNRSTPVAQSCSDMTVVFSNLPQSLVYKPYVSHCTNPEGCSSMCIFRTLFRIILPFSRGIENDRLRTAEFL